MPNLTHSNDIETKIKSVAMLTRAAPVFESYNISQVDLNLINQLAPGQLTADRLFVRSMFLCSSQACDSDGCKFTRAALADIANRIAGQSVLTGHDRSSLPLARFFKASVVERGTESNGEPIYFVRAWFYWLRETSGAKDLLLNIDGGIYREASLAWKYDSWRCSICGATNGHCGHRPGSQYSGQTCYRLIDRVTDVLEGSLVYKSADRNTHLAGIREERSNDIAEPILFVCDEDDPLLAILDSYGVLTDRCLLSDLAESLPESARQMWARGRSEARLNQLAERFLTPDGIGLGEVLNRSNDDCPVNGEPIVLTANQADVVLSSEIE